MKIQIKLVIIVFALFLIGLLLLSIVNLTGHAVESQATSYIDNCTLISSSGNYILNQSINSTGSCLDISASNVVLDCNNFAIYYAEGANGIGISVSGNANDVTIRNCNLIKNTTFGNSSYGISIAGSTSVTKVYNANIMITGERLNYGIYALAGSSGVDIQNSSISTNGTNTANYGIYLVSTNNNVLNNSVSTRGTTANYGIYINNAPSTTIKGNTVKTSGTTTNYGIYCAGTSNFVTIDSNLVNSSGTGTNYAIYVNTPDSYTITNNIINANGTAASNYGIYLLSSTGNSISGNTVSTSGTTTNHGILLQSSYANINNNVISTRGTVSDAIRLITSSSVNLADNNLSTQFAWITLLTSSSAFFNNTYFLTSFGNMFYPEFNLSDSAINQTVLNISQNRAYVNSSRVSNLNRSAKITLINGSGPEILVDYNDDGVYEACISQCNAVSFSPTELIFNVTGFTSYSSTSIVPNVSGLIPSQVVLTFNAAQAIEIGANVSDNFGIESVEAQITLTGGSINQKIMLVNSSDPGKFNVSYTIPNQNGLYNVVINATDINGLTNSSETTRFNVIGATAEAPAETDLGGGGGGSVVSNKLTDKKESTTTLFDITAEIVEKGFKIINAKQFEKIEMSVLNQTHHITLADILEDSVKLVIESEVQTAVINVGEESTFDVSGDGAADIAIKLEAIENQTAVLVIKDLHWELPEQEAISGGEAESSKRSNLASWTVALVSLFIILIAFIAWIFPIIHSRPKIKHPRRHRSTRRK